MLCFVPSLVLNEILDLTSEIIYSRHQLLREIWGELLIAAVVFIEILFEVVEIFLILYSWLQ